MLNAVITPCDSHGNPQQKQNERSRRKGPGMISISLIVLLFLSVGICLAGDKGNATSTAEQPEPAAQLPAMDEFTPMETVPQMIKQTRPVYPEAEEENGVEGIVWVKALVGKSGTVLGAVVFKSSGSEALDASAIKAAVNNRFTPGIQNGKPVAAWISYKVTFATADEKTSEE